MSCYFYESFPKMTVNKIKHIKIWISHDFENEKRELLQVFKQSGEKTLF